MNTDIAFRILLFLGVAGSVWASGATIILAVGAIWGILSAIRHGLPSGFCKPFTALSGLILLVLFAEAANGGSAESTLATALAYLPLMLAPAFAIATMRVGLTPEVAVIPLSAGLILFSAIGIAMSHAHQWGNAQGIGYGPMALSFCVTLWLLFAAAQALLGAASRMPAGIAALAGLAALVVGQSKGAIAAAAFALAMVMLCGLSRLRSLRVLAVLAIVLVGAGLGAWTLMEDELREGYYVVYLLLLGGSIADGSIMPRYEMVIAGWQAFQDSPLVGHGFAEQIAAALPYERDWGMSFGVLSTLHIEYLVHLVSFGIFGLVFLLGFLALLLWLAAGQSNPVARAYGFGVATFYAVFMLFDHAFNYGPLTGPGAIVLGLLIAWRAQGRQGG